MKYLPFIFSFFMITTMLSAQEIVRIEVSGKIIASNDLEGVTIFNTSSNQGTVADLNGKFKIEVALNDVLDVSALQYKSVKVVVDENVIKSKQLYLFLIEELNKLNEIILLSSGLTGEIKVDIGNTKERKVVVMNFGDLSGMEYPIDRFTKVDNPLMKQGQFYNGINLASIFGLNKLINKPKNRLSYAQMDAINKKNEEVPEVNYPPEYFNKNFNIPLDQKNEFLAFVYINGFDRSLLEEANEMKLLEFLLAQSKLFLNLENEKN